MGKEVDDRKEKGDTDSVVVGILSRDRDGVAEYLLISSKKDFGEYTGFYYPPGGHAKENEDIGSALIRELKEELCIDVEIGEELAETTSDVKKQTTHWYSCIANSFEIDIRDENIADARWMTKEEILKSGTVWPATKKFFLEYV